MRVIIITQQEKQVKKLHEMYWGRFDNIGFWGQKQQDFNKEWHWVIDGNYLSGTSGHKSLDSTIERCQGFKIYHFQDFFTAKTLTNSKN